MPGRKGAEGGCGASMGMGQGDGGMVTHPASEAGNAFVDMQTMQPSRALDDPGIGLREEQLKRLRADWKPGHRVLRYADLRSAFADPDGREPGRTVTLHLTGHMERYAWSFDGVRFAASEPLRFTYAPRGWDFLVFDAEHGPLQPREVEDLCRAIEPRGTTPIVRVTTNDAPTILRFLDIGTHGVHVPWVNTAADAERAVRAVKYTPRGIRGLAGSRASEWGLREPIADYVARANRETLVVIQVETLQLK